MPAAPTRIAVLFLIALCGCAAAQEGKNPAPTSAATTPQSTNSSGQTVQTLTSQLETRATPRSICEKRTYKLKMISDGFNGPPPSSPREDKGHWYGMAYVSPTGIGVSVTTADFRSSAAASKAFQAMVTDAMKVIERSPAKGHELPANSDRILMMWKSGSFSIVWLDRKFVRSIDSHSLQELRKFEETMEFDCK
jgi:hypothetical protein